jgi:hypothetical protein
MIFLRLINLLAIACLIGAAAYVYDIKYDTTRRAQKVAHLRIEVRHEREQIASLRARWAQLENPIRIEQLTDRFLHLEPVKPEQFGVLATIPDRPPQPDEETEDLIGAFLEKAADVPTGSIAGHAPASHAHKPSQR